MINLIVQYYTINKDFQRKSAVIPILLYNVVDYYNLHNDRP